MKRLIVILILVVSIPSFGQHTKTRMPSYEQVVTKFYTNYNVKSKHKSEPIKVEFEKRPLGWFVKVVEGYQLDKILYEHLYWDRINKNYNPLELDYAKRNSTSSKSDIRYALREDRFDNYLMNYYYGYDGWYEDVIEEFGNKKRLSDSLNYAMARAYSAKASNLLTDNSGSSVEKDRFVLELGENSLTKTQLKKYRKYRHAAIYYFQKVEKQNPYFNTVVGAIGMKVSNEHVTSFLDLKQFQNHEEAMKELRPGLYTPSMISTAKNYLESCDSNAILFVNGDNDTYPLIYVQEVMEFRKDILIVNLSLLNTTRYFDCMTNYYDPNHKFPTSFSKEELDEQELMYVYVGKSHDTISIKHVMDTIHNKGNVFTINSKRATKYHKTVGDRLFLEGKDSIMHIKLRAGHLIRSKFIWMDMLVENNWESPVYFAISVGKDQYSEFKNYMELSGLTYKLTDRFMTSLDGRVHSGEIAADNVLNKFHWDGHLSLDGLTGEIKMNITYTIMYSTILDDLRERNKKKEAIELIELFEKNTKIYSFNDALYRMYSFESYRLYLGEERAKKYCENLIQEMSKRKNEVDEKRLENAKSSFKYFMGRGGIEGLDHLVDDL